MKGYTVWSVKGTTVEKAETTEEADRKRKQHVYMYIYIYIIDGANDTHTLRPYTFTCIRSQSYGIPPVYHQYNRINRIITCTVNL